MARFSPLHPTITHPRSFLESLPGSCDMSQLKNKLTNQQDYEKERSLKSIFVKRKRKRKRLRKRHLNLRENTRSHIENLDLSLRYFPCPGPLLQLTCGNRVLKEAMKPESIRGQRGCYSWYVFGEMIRNATNKVMSTQWIYAHYHILKMSDFPARHFFLFCSIYLPVNLNVI